MKRYFLAFFLTLALVLPFGLQAKTHEAKGLGTEYNTRTAKVLEVNQADHSVVLEGEAGTKMNLKLDPNRVKNFDQIKKGDVVVLRTTKTLLSVNKAKSDEKIVSEISETETAPQGSKPGMEREAVRKVTAEVTKVDVPNSMVELKGMSGKTLALTAKDPKHLQGVKVGDLVTVTYSVDTDLSMQGAN